MDLARDVNSTELDRPTSSQLSQASRVIALVLLALLYLYWLHPLLMLGSGTFIRGHSPLYDIFRSVGVIDAWRSGIWDARMIPCFNQHYGYPILGLYAPAFFWTGGGCILLTGSWQWGMTLTVALWLACGLLGVFLAARQLWSVSTTRRNGFWAGWLACVGWLISPYIAFNIYERSDGAEFAASMMLPWIFWSGIRLLGLREEGTWRRILMVVPLSGSIAVAIGSHNVYGIYCIGYAMAIPLVCWALPAGSSPGKGRWLVWGNLRWYLLGVATGLCLSLFLWLPAMVEMHYTRVYSMFSGDTGRMQRSLMTLSELVRFETVVKHIDFDRPVPWHPQLGWVCAAAALSVLGAVSLAVIHRRLPLLRPIGVLVAATIATVWLLTVYSEPLWVSSPLLCATQFAWRTCSFSAFALCLLLPALPMAAASLQGRARQVVLLGWILIFAGVTIRSINLYVYRSSMPLPDASTLWNGRILTANKDEYATIWQQRREPHIWPAGEVLPAGPMQVVGRRGTFNRMRIDVVNPAQEPGSLQVAYNYFPGWYAYTKGGNQPLGVEPGDRGIIRITRIPTGTHTIRLAFGNTPIRLATKIISGVTALTLLAGAVAANAARRKSVCLGGDDVASTGLRRSAAAASSTRSELQ